MPPNCQAFSPEKKSKKDTKNVDRIPKSSYSSRMTNRQQAIRIVNRVCFQTCGLVLNDLPDLPSIMYAIDEMEEIIACEGETASIAELEDIAQEAVMELLEEEGMDELYV